MIWTGLRRFCLLTAVILFSNLHVDALTFHLSASQVGSQSELQGTWRVSTEILWSDCPYVKEGTKSASKLVISNINGKLFPHWEANDWLLVRNNSISFTSDDKFLWERENKLFKDGKYWFVEAIDKFALVSRGSMQGQSLIKQYLNGEYVGSYISYSTLEKIT